MDTSKKYIKMCREAEEIQLYRTLWKRCKAGDFAYNADEDIVEVQEDVVMLLAEDVWLPRQDQLQEMVFGNYPNDSSYCGCVINSLGAWFNWREHKRLFSMEQLWLAFVMREKFQKLWNDKEEKWEKIN